MKVIPIEGLALLLNVDRFMSEARAITNFIGNAVATVLLANNGQELDRRMMEAAFTGWLNPTPTPEEDRPQVTQQDGVLQ